jgi:hypothetical protein
MSKNRIVLTLGAILILIPFLGFPSRWENFFSVLFGLILVFLALSVSIKRRATAFKVGRTKKDSSALFVDGYGSTPPPPRPKKKETEDSLDNTSSI